MLNVLELERFIRATAARADLRIEWTEKNTPNTNGKTMQLPRPLATFTNKEADQLRNSVRHEVGHHLYTDFDCAKETGTTPGPAGGLLGCMWNMFEDVRIDTLGSREYQGDREIANRTYEHNLGNLYKQAANPEADKEAVRTMIPLLHMCNDVYKDVFSTAEAMERDGEKVSTSTPETKEVWDKLSKNNYADVLRNICSIKDKKEGTKASLDLAERVLREVFDLDPEEERKKAQEQQKAEGKGEAGEGKEGEGGGEGKEEKSKKGGKKGHTPVVKYQRYLLDSKDNDSGKGHHLDYSSYVEYDTYQPATQEQYTVYDYTKGDSGYGRREPREYGKEIVSTLQHTSHGFANRVRTILQVRAKDSYQYGLKRGKLNIATTYRVTMKDAKGFNERVFKKKQESNVLDCAVSILVDQSGSMRGAKYIHAACASVMLNETIGNVLHIPTEIMGFSSAGYCSMHIHRTYNDNLVSKDQLIERLDRASSNMSGNPDGDAIMFAFDRLMKRKEKRKLLIVCSDGSPSGGATGGDIVRYTREVVKAIEKESPVSIVGIGICDDNVAMFYKEHYVIKNSNELETALLRVIEGKLK